MGTLLVQVGQCGNQIGLKLWDQLKAQHLSSTDFMFRNGESVSHSVLIDSEPKVLRDIKNERLTYSHFDPNNIIYYQHGRGNNWAMGYFNAKNYKQMNKNAQLLNKFDKLNILEKASLVQKIKQPQNTKSNMTKDFTNDETIMRENSVILEQASTLIQKEIEKVDCYTGTMFVYSIAGGTGSGVGSRVLETMRDDYSANYLYNVCIFPSHLGDNPLQQYNSVLSLSHMQQYSDAVIYFQNEKVQKFLTRSGSQTQDKMINIDDLNGFIASQLTNMFKINDLKSSNQFYFDYLNDITSLGECKFVELFGAPFVSRNKRSLGPESTWEAAFDQTFLQLGFDFDMNDASKEVLKEQTQPVNATLALKCILRSGDIDTSFLKNEAYKKTLTYKINQGFHPLKWNPDAVGFDYHKEKMASIGDVKTMVVMANRLNIVNNLQEILDIARSKYKAKAYLHWYYKYGMEEEDFMLAFENIETIIDNYLMLLDE